MVLVIKRNTPKGKLKAILKRARPVKRKGFDARKHLGKMKVGADTLALQKQFRNEWA